VIDCVITNGTPAATGCSKSYPANTPLTLTATPAAGYAFSGWRDPACGTGACQFSVIKPATVPVTFSSTVTGTPAREGRWEAVFSTPAVAVHVHLTPSGKVFFWGDTGDAETWNPANPAAGFVPVAKPYRLYCSGHTILPDGRVLVVGGTSPGTRGLRFASVFDPVARTWSRTSSMAQGRYYPTTTVLPNGNVLAISGHDTTLNVVTIPEVWNGASWRRLTTAPLAIPNPYYPAMFVAPNGKVFLAGFPQTTRYLDVNGTGQWTTVGNRVVANRTLGSAVMYAPGKILYSGGGDPPTATAEVIDLEHGGTWRSVPGMAFARRQMNATILADGTVLVTGGTSGPGFNDQAGAVHTAELWDPATETWKTMASEARHRTYHSTAILLPSGRVLSSGSGEGGGITFANSELSAQIFSPPYLFNPDGTPATRPTITAVPARISYAQPFTVQTPNAGSVSRGTLIRLSSVTHAFNQSQMIYPLTFAATSATSLSAMAPPTPNHATPGTYMLFLINNAGVPSTALMTVVGP
jgi:galactose oxidase